MVNPGELRVETVLTPSHLVSGGDVLIRVEPLFGGTLDGLTVSLNGVDVTDRFQPAPDDWLGRESPALLGSLDGLADGNNKVVVAADQPVASLTVTNYPITGPILSGEPLEPYFCLEDLELDRQAQPQRFTVGNGDFITGGKLDVDCSLVTRVDYVYRTSGEDGKFVALGDPGQLPTNVAVTTTTTGVTAPYIVRLETGTINRAIYQTAMLIDPDQFDPTPWARPPGWNGRLVYTYGGGGCEAGFFQGTRTGAVLRDPLLSKGMQLRRRPSTSTDRGGATMSCRPRRR